MERWVIILIIIIFAFFLFWLIAGGQEYDFKGFLSTCRVDDPNIDRGIKTPGTKYPKSPLDATPRVATSQVDELDEKNNSKTESTPSKKSFKIKIKPNKHIFKQQLTTDNNLMSLPNNIVAVEEQDQTLHDVMILEESFYGQKKQRVISKRYNDESKGECICRHILEDIYGEQFIRIRPDFLKYPDTNQKLELDGWCVKLKIAFEYNGAQHYKYNKFFHPTEEHFYKQVYRDNWKFNRMNELGYYLITVPYTVPHSMIRQYIDYYLPENVIKRQSES